jgi:quercetin dioxygenase-like cupin family protein
LKVTLEAGEAFFIHAGVVRNGRSVGSGPAKVLATYIVEKRQAGREPGQPLITSPHRAAAA